MLLTSNKFDFSITQCKLLFYILTWSLTEVTDLCAMHLSYPGMV